MSSADRSAVARQAAFEALERSEARRLTALRLELLDCHPFWGHLLLHVKLVPTPQLTTFAATDCTKHIWYNPLWTQHLDMRQLGFVLAHEVGHHVLESLERRGTRDAYVWNCATDYAINRMVAGIRRGSHGPMYRLPDGDYPVLGEIRCLYDPRFDGLSAEQIYVQLLDEPPRLLQLYKVDLPGDDEDERVVADHGGGIDVHMPRGLTEAERGELLDRLTAAVAAGRDAGCGELPAEVERLVERLRPPKVPWQRLLARIVGESQARQDYSYARPNRRWLAEDVLMPGLHSEELSRVVVAVDTSGSVSQELLGAIASELSRLYAVVGELTVLIADAKVHAEVTARELPAFLAQKRFVGGGGTDHRPVFEWIAQRRLEPELFIGLSDLHSKFPERPPRYPVLWVTPEKHGRAPWGSVVEAAL